MNKIVSMTCVMLFFSLPLTTFAYHPLDELAPCPQLLDLNDGVYMGLGLGHDVFRLRQHFAVQDSLGNLVSAGPAVAVNGGHGNVFLGYGRYFNWFYMAGEVEAGISNAKEHFSLQMPTLTYNTDMDVRASFGLHLLPGIKLNESSLLYLKLGVVRTSIKVNESGMAALPLSVSHQDWYNGLNMGIGIETALSRHTGLRLEYAHTSYDASVSLLETKFSPANHQLMLSLLYHFG